MSLFQRPAVTREEVEANRPLAIPPEQLLEIDESEWYARIYRPGATQLTVRAVVLGSVLGFFLCSRTSNVNRSRLRGEGDTQWPPGS